jgi:F0F1-type ATP synthase epsilon subunit
MGILSNHVPSIEALRPGVVEVIEEGGKTGKYFGEYRLGIAWNTDGRR